MKTKSKSGFTLIELMVVAIIVAILAAVAIPLMTAQKKRAAATEGESGLGAIRTAMRANYAESGAYDKDARTQAALTAPVAATNMPGVNASDLDGRYFRNSDYRITAVAPTTYTLEVRGNTTDVAGVVITLDQSGAFNRTGL